MKIRDLIKEITIRDIDLNRDIIVTENEVIYLPPKEPIKAKLSECKDGACEVMFEDEI